MLTLFIGSTNRSGASIRNDCGITVYTFDENSLASEIRSVDAGIDNPSYLVLDPGGRQLYAVSEVGTWPECTVSAYRIDDDGACLHYMNKQPTQGRTTCHVNMLPGGRVGVANYSDGGDGPGRAFCVFPVSEEGHLGAAEASATHEGEIGPNSERQERSHAHCVMPTVDGRAVLVADLGLDCVIGYEAQSPWTEMFRVALPAGFGPRHIACHPEGQFVYVMNELEPYVSILGWNGEQLSHEDDVLAVPEALRDQENWGAGIQMSADGRFLYVSIRGSDVLSVFAVSADGRTLSLIDTVACGGAWPRSFSLTPSGRHVLVANQRSDGVAVLERDEETGLLRDKGVRIAVPAPQCVKAQERAN